MPWASRVTEASIPATANAILDLLNEIELSDSTVVDHQDRARWCVETVLRTITSIDPRLIPQGTINQLAKQLNQLKGHLDQLHAGAANIDWTGTTGPVDATLAALATMPSQASNLEASAEIGSLRRSVGQHRGQVDREIEDMRASSAKAQKAFEEQTGTAATKVAELEAEVNRLREELNQTVGAARDQANQQQNTFAAAQEQRQETFSKLLEEKRAEANDAVTNLTSKAETDISELRQSVESDVAAAATSKERIEEILGIVSEEALIGAHSKLAADDKKQADQWRLLAVLMVIISAAIGAWIVASTGDPGTDWDRLAAKVLLALPFVGIAAYAAKQSAEHRHVQREAEHMALQLATLGPYLDDIEEEGGKGRTPEADRREDLRSASTRGCRLARRQRDPGHRAAVDRAREGDQQAHGVARRCGVARLLHAGPKSTPERGPGQTGNPV